MASNADTIRQLYRAFAIGDVASVLGMMDDKVEWREPVALPFEDQVGPTAIAENVFATLPTLFESFSVDATEVVDAGDVVVGVGAYRGVAKETGRTLEADFVHLWRFGADGKITFFRTYTDTHLWRQALGVG